MQSFESQGLDQGLLVHGTPIQPAAIFQSEEDALDLLLARVCGDDLFGGPVQAVGEQHGAPQALSEEMLKGRRIRSQTANAIGRRAWA
jgi:hypothetical protein